MFRRSFFTILLHFQRENFFPPACKHQHAKFDSFLVFADAAASFTAKILFHETVAKREAILNNVPEQ